MSLQVIEAQTGDNPTATILIMHGLGADGRDFLPIAEQLDLSAVGPVRFLFPSAPHLPVTINGGYAMPAWYDIVGADLTSRQDEAGMRRSQAAMEAILANEKARGIPAGRIVIAGFSQGCAMALMAGLRHPERLAGIAGLSGYLPLAELTAAQASAANRDVPVFLAPRHAGQRRAAAARAGLARRAGGHGLRGRMARLPDGPLGLPRGGGRPAGLVAARAGLSRVSSLKKRRQPRPGLGVQLPKP